MNSRLVTVVVTALLIGVSMGYYVSQSSNSKSAERLRELEGIIADFSINITSLTSQVTDLTREKSILQSSYDALGSELEYVKANLTVLEADKLELKQSISQLQVEYDELYFKYQAVKGGSIGDATESIAKSYSWSYSGKEWSIELQIPKATYEYYRDHERPQTENMAIYVTHPNDDLFLRGVAERFLTISRQNSYSKAQEVNFVASFVQSIPYAFDNVTTGYQEYARYPLETLVDGFGDCECKSILAAQLLDLMGYKLVIINLPEHVAVGVYLPNGSGASYTLDGVKYLYLETTRTGWSIGVIPPIYSGISAKLDEVEPIAVTSVSFTWKWIEDKIEVIATVENEGTAIATGLSLQSGLDAGNNMYWSLVKSDSFDVAIESEKTVQLTLSPPDDKHTRVAVFLLSSQGYSLEKEFSGWFDT